MKRIFSLIILLVLMPGTASALGLGNLELNSALNEPFSGRITLLSATADELDSLRVGLADGEAFARAGIDRPFVLSKLKFTLRRAVDEGPDVIVITSQGPIREPFLNFLVEISWSKGRLFREYTVLLDPPLYDPNARAVGLRTTETIRDIPTPAPAPAASVIDENHQVVYADDFEQYQSGAVQQPTISYGGGDYGPTAGADTLWSIASAMRPDSSVSVNQMMLALLSTNPEAFLNGNINGLKRGQILRMPAADTINAMSQAQALEEVKAQYAAWDQMTGVVSSTVTERPETISAPTEIEAEESMEAAAVEDDAELKLVAASEEMDATEQAVSVEAGVGEDLVIAQESIQALTQENLELKDQLQESEALLSDLKRLLELKDDELATLQQQLASQPEEIMEEEMAVVDEEEMMEEAEEEAAEVMEEAAMEEAMEEAEEEVAVEEVIEEVTEPEAVTEEVVEVIEEEEMAVVDEVETIDVIETEPAAEAGGVMGMLDTYLGPIKDMLLGNILYGIAALGLLVVLVLLAVVMKFRKKTAEKSSAEAETVEAFPDFSASESDLDEAQAELGSEAETALPESEDETFIPGDSEPEAEIAEAEVDVEKTVMAEPEPEAEEEEEEDPLQEVNTYLAFEQFDQAEEFVRNAINDKPDNPEYHTKLLEVFYTSGNKKAYEEEARALNDLVNGEGEHWDMALAMWSEMSPNRALFEAGGEEEEDTSDTTGGGFVDVTADEEAADEGALDFDIGTGDTAAEETQAETAESEEELLDITAADEGEDILDVTAAVGLEEAESAQAENEEEDILDISGSSAGEDLLDVTAAAGAEEQGGAEEEMLDISSSGAGGDDLLDLTAGDESPAGEDLLDVTAAANLEPDTDEDLLDVTAATSAGADSDELLDLDIESSETAEEPESSDNVIDFDLATGGDSEAVGLDTEEETVDVEAENLEEGLELDLGEAAEESTEDEEPIRLDMDIEEESSDAGDETHELSIDLDMGETEAAPAEEESADAGIELSLDESSAEPDIELDGTVELPKATETEAEESAGMDFDLSLDESSAEPDIEMDGTVELPKLDVAADEEDEDDDDDEHTVFVPRAAQPEEQSAEDEIATKLDLAKAYVELGDKDSAKTILDEVLAEGNDEQKKQAQDLMGQI